MFMNLIPSTLSRAIMAAFIFIAAALPSHAQQYGDFTYSYSNNFGGGYVITGYTGTGGAVYIPERIYFYDNDPWAYFDVTAIERSAFSDKDNITSVTIPRTVKSIGWGAFHGCRGLTSVTIPNSVTSIWPEAFSGCSGLTSLTIGSGVTSIGGYAFSGCTRLTSVTIPNSVTSIGYSAFEDCSGLTSVTIGSGVTRIEGGAFKNCRGLTSVTIPNSVTSIAYGAFWQCYGLTSVTIGNSVTSIVQAAFLFCTGLTSVTIPSSVTSIGRDAFYGCTGLTSVYFQGNAPSVSVLYGSGSGLLTDAPATVYYRAGTTGWGTSFAGRPTVQFGGITSQPVNVTTLQGTSATFTVTLIGATSYQWLKNGVNIPLATSSTLILSNVQQADATNYSVIVSDPAGNLTSNTATLTVIPDTDLDGLSDAEEASLATNPNNSDSDGDGLSDRAEIQVYLTNALVKDTDSDGFEDGYEVSTGFNPALASSSPDSVSAIDNAVRFRFNAGLGLSYRIEDSTDLQTWTTLESPIVGAGVEVTRYYPVVGQPKRYFRVKKN